MTLFGAGAVRRIISVLHLLLILNIWDQKQKL